MEIDLVLTLRVKRHNSRVEGLLGSRHYWTLARSVHAVTARGLYERLRDQMMLMVG